MTKTEEMIRFETDLNASAELREKLEATIKRIVGEGLADSDGELLEKAAAELGYQVKAAELERTLAEQAELSPDELEQIGAGVGHEEDQDGHDLWCLTAWHCYVATIHTTPPDGGHETPCWKTYMCMFVNKK